MFSISARKSHCYCKNMFRNRIILRMLNQQQNFVKIPYSRLEAHVLSSKSNRASSTFIVEDGYVKKFMKAVGWMDPSRTRLKLSGYFLYENIPAKVAYEDWFESLELPDTFSSWFNITELHVWMLMVRFMAEDIEKKPTEKKKYVDGDGHFVRNCIIEALWADVSNRIKLLEGANPSVAKKQVSDLSQAFQAALVAYDEGLSDDRVLAAAVWRRFYSLSDDIKAENIENIVKFIRHQVSLLDKIPGEELIRKPGIEWLSILSQK